MKKNQTILLLLLAVVFSFTISCKESADEGQDRAEQGNSPVVAPAPLPAPAPVVVDASLLGGEVILEIKTLQSSCSSNSDRGSQGSDIKSIEDKYVSCLRSVYSCGGPCGSFSSKLKCAKDCKELLQKNRAHSSKYGNKENKCTNVARKSLNDYKEKRCSANYLF